MRIRNETYSISNDRSTNPAFKSIGQAFVPNIEFSDTEFTDVGHLAKTVVKHAVTVFVASAETSVLVDVFRCKTYIQVGEDFRVFAINTERRCQSGQKADLNKTLSLCDKGFGGTWGKTAAPCLDSLFGKVRRDIFG